MKFVCLFIAFIIIVLDLGLVWFRNNSVFKTHISNPKLIILNSNLTFTQKL